MPAYSGKFQYLSAAGKTLQQASCELSFDSEACVVTPAGGTPLAFDLGDVDRFTPGEWDLSLELYTGDRLQLRQFGPAFGSMSGELLAAWRDRTVRCLLLEDLREVARFDAVAGGVSAEVRICASNLAVLPLGGQATQWRLAEVDSIAFDDSSYSFHLRSGAASLTVAKLGKRTDEFGQCLHATVDALRRQAAEALHQAFPFLDALALRKLLALLPEGRSASLAAMAAVHPGLPDAFVARAVSRHLQPYFDVLKSRAGDLMAGFKFVRPGDDDAEVMEPDDDAAAAESAMPLFFWFFFPFKDCPVAAWEATSGSGRATYFFRTAPPVEESIAAHTRGLALVNFRREPVYLPDASLDQQPQFHRYAIGRRKLPELAALRAAFLGRAIHSSLEEWKAQLPRFEQA